MLLSNWKAVILFTHMLYDGEREFICKFECWWHFDEKSLRTNCSCQKYLKTPINAIHMKNEIENSSRESVLYG